MNLPHTPAGYLRLELTSEVMTSLIWHHRGPRLLDQPGQKIMPCGTKFLRHREYSFMTHMEPAHQPWSCEHIRTSANRPFDATNAWRPTQDDMQPMLTASWEEPQIIQQVELQFAS